ncbi:uridine phosphorylase 1-like [Actinia tenebrosa]|uniref:Uridine phosphorylase 1-like n=1 Tax=Actinia tenebrosa TaxID=6105 RepID=A0A6P8HK51_ACTTE|nr:uridine phosphorylase 1-like [Actinia tenebrosa]XP_031556754.1 uridine phosphorylase 1-like [Actinia tenebrosa]
MSDEEEKQTIQFVKNPHLSSLEDDVLFHIGIKAKDGLKEPFGDVKFVCMGGSTDRIRQFAKFLQNELSDYLENEDKKEPKNLSNTDRYAVYKVGPALVINHGIGIPSLMVIMHETLKLLYHADAKDVTFFRIGTSGGLGLTPGTVVLTKSSMNALLEPYHEQIILGEVVKFPATLDDDLRKQLIECGKDTGIPMAEGHTMCTNDFYEGQGRLDGAFCDYTLEDKLIFLDKVHKAGVRNIEMESVCFAAMCNRAGVKAAILCVTLLDRLKGDQVHLKPEDHEDFQARPPKIVAGYIKKYLEEQAKSSSFLRNGNKRAKANM